MTTVDQTAPSRKTLAHFDLTQDALAQIISDAHAERASLLARYYPRNASGLTFYFHVVGGLRQYLMEKRRGWKDVTDHGLEFVENEKKRLRIGYCSADEATGIEGRSPRSRRRGSASMYAASKNMLQTLLRFPTRFLTDRPEKPDGPDAGEVQSWFLAVFRSATAYRLELALPIKCSDGQFVGWADRVFIDEIPLDSEPRLDAVPSVPTPSPPKPRRRNLTAKDDRVTKKASGTDQDE